MIEIKHVTKIYADIQVSHVEDVVFQQGKAHGLLGANGAGKSTLIKMVMGLVFASSGAVHKPDAISFLPEHTYLPLNLTAYQMLQHVCSVQGCDQTKNLLQEVGLKPAAWHKPMRSYSKGMKQRVAIACVLAGNPEWFILDEPMSGLDAMGRRQMLDIFFARKDQGSSVLMCSHAVTDLVRLCDAVHVMAKGEICETFVIQEHSMLEVEQLEARLQYWSGIDVVD